MLVVGLTGGIGAGKSTVAAMLRDRGAVVIDADQIARQVVEPGTVGYVAVVARFGSPFVRADGRLDRRALADLVFADPQARADLNAIVHPRVRAVVANRLAAEAESEATSGELAATDHVVVLEVPLLVEAGTYDVAGVIVVDCPEEEAVRRLVENRRMDEADVRRRIAAQATREARLARAGLVIDNGGSRAELEAEVDRAWEWIRSLPTADW